MARQKRWNPGEFDHGVQVLELSSWKYFYDYIHQEMLDYKGYVFRGQGSSSWDLVSTLERKLENIARKQWAKRTENHLEDFKYAIRGRRGLNPAPLSNDNDWWAMGQHNGLATPLLDWTESPFVALYFAFAEALISPKGPRAVYALHRLGATQAGIDLANPLTDDNQRLVNQAGLFTRSPDDKSIIEAIKDHHNGTTSIVLLKIVLPNRDREKCLKRDCK